jgi:hypothetical protein
VGSGRREEKSMAGEDRDEVRKISPSIVAIPPMGKFPAQCIKRGKKVMICGKNMHRMMTARIGRR